MCVIWACGVALMGDGLSLLQIWKWTETCAVRLMYYVAFSEMMKQTVALTIYRHAHFPKQTLYSPAWSSRPQRFRDKCI